MTSVRHFVSGLKSRLRTVRADRCWVLPDGVDAVSAACVPVAFGTAYEALFELGDVTKRSAVLLQGAASDVCLAAVQLAPGRVLG